MIGRLLIVAATSAYLVVVVTLPEQATALAAGYIALLLTGEALKWKT